MTLHALVTDGLALLALLSPLLTLAALLQLKEWRFDRLREHLKREGFLILVSVIRIAVVIVALVCLLLPIPYVSDIALGVLAALTVVQVTLRRQPLPTWTSKALTVVALATVLDCAIIVALNESPAPALLLLLPVLQALPLFIAWTALMPLDTSLKRRTFLRAKTVRETAGKLLVIGITGSVGKTTTKELLTHILRERHPLSTPAHVNSEMGVARWLIRTLEDRPVSQDTPMIVEMGAYRRGEIATLCDIVGPTIGIVTFIGSQHLALFGSQQALLEAKGELLRALPKDGKAFLNADCALCRNMAQFCACPVTFVGTGERTDLRATDIEETTSGLSFRLGDVTFRVPMHGTHNVSNIVLATAAAEACGMERSRIAQALANFRPLRRTFEVREERGITILDDTHNASAASFRAAIAWADAQPFQRKTLLTSGLIELGEEHGTTHRELGSLASDVFEKIVFLNENGRAFFAEGYGKPVSVLSRSTDPIASGSLLVCVGRMPPSIIRRLLPS